MGFKRRPAPSDLRTRIEDAARQAFLEMLESHPDEHVYAFALYSDEDAMTVCPSTNTIEYCEKQAQADPESALVYKFEPAEWKYEMVGADEAFNRISAELYESVRTLDGAALERFRSTLFETCIAALETLRSERFFLKANQGRDVFVHFTVSDYDLSDQDIEATVKRLNDDPFKAEYLTWMSHWGSDVALGGLTGVLTKNAVPAPKYRLSLRGEDWRIQSIDIDSPDGRYTVARLESGRYKVQAIAPEGSATGEAVVEAGRQATLDLELAGWGSVAGQVVAATDGTPIVGLSYLASTDGVQDNSNVVLTGGGPKTDGTGQFVVDKLGPGAVRVAFFTSNSIGDLQEAGGRSFELMAGQNLDLGVIRVIPPVEVPADQQGSLGLRVVAALWGLRPGAEEGTAGRLPPGLNAAVEYGWVAFVVLGSVAAAAGMQVGDRLVAIDGTQVADVGASTAIVALGLGRVRVGQVVRLDVDRGGQALTVTLTAEPSPL